MTKKLKVMLLMLLLVFSMVSLSGCSLLNKGDSEETQETEETKEDEEDNDEDEEEEEDEEDEEWIPNLDLVNKPSTTEDPIDENIDAVCTCARLCMTDSIDPTCIVCSEDFHKCVALPEEDPLDQFALPEGQTETVSIAAFGSNFYNTAVMNGTDKSYNYDYIYENIKEMLKNYDVKIVTQETTFVNDPSKYSGGPQYKTPPSTATALTNAGFNVIAHATDHAYDNGKNGILETLDTWKQYSNTTLVTGIYASEEAYNNISIAEVNGIVISFLNYTSSLNGVTLTNDEKTYVKTLYNEDLIAEEIAYAAKTTDFVVVLPHWGSDDSTTHSANQEKWAQVFIDNGADLIIGTGSDTVQDVVLYQNTEGQYIPCYYSLGNFVSGKESPEEVLSGVAEITISKTGKVTTLENYNMIPLALHVSKKGDFFKSYLLDEYPADTIKWHNLIQNGKDLSLNGMQEQFKSTVEIVDIKNYKPASEGSTMTIITQPRPSSTEPPVDTEEDNGGNPLVEEDSNGNNSQTGGLSGMQVIGG